ncbi:MAG: GGDEF domain-containing protein [Nanoarchaeota archaeon]|nr:GGDEF domain-containing protein [Nanoarchaeota archaeon]
MDKNIKKKISVLHPDFRKKITELFDNLNESISFLYEVAIKDEKTGLYNNKFFETTFEMEFEKAKRGYGKLSLIMIDIDFFKKINDTYGHIKADEFLERLGKILKKQIRKSDIASRFGGEEFLILLPETSLSKAKKFASRLKKTINSDKILKKGNLTVSGGIAQYKKGDTKKKLKKRADTALYQAKNGGRNRFVALK